MKQHTMLHLFRVALVVGLAAVGSGCASNGYISSVVTTGLGLDVSENPQTQIPHVRFGYIRNGVYYIPTGKTGNPQGNASETPNVVSKIHVGSEFLKNISITEKFAVGDAAVSTRAAHQLFVDTTSETANTTRGGPAQAPVIVGPTADNPVVATFTKRTVQETKRPTNHPGVLLGGELLTTEGIAKAITDATPEQLIAFSEDPRTAKAGINTPPDLPTLKASLTPGPVDKKAFSDVQLALKAQLANKGVDRANLAPVAKERLTLPVH